MAESTHTQGAESATWLNEVRPQEGQASSSRRQLEDILKDFSPFRVRDPKVSLIWKGIVIKHVKELIAGFGSVENFMRALETVRSRDSGDDYQDEEDSSDSEAEDGEQVSRNWTKPKCLFQFQK